MVASYVHPDVLDSGPAEIKANASLFTLCSGMPANRDEAVVLDGRGGKRTAGKVVDTNNFTLGAGVPNGRTLTMSSLSGVVFQSNVTSTHMALTDATRLLFAIEMASPITIPAGGNSALIVTLTDFSLRFPTPQPHSMLSAIGAGGPAPSAISLALDAGASESFSGTGQLWSDLSPGGFDFYRGLSGSPSTDDPAFNGVAGARSSAEYFSFDSSDNFFFAGSANESWMDAMHQDGATFTAIAVVNLSGFSIQPALCGTGGASFGPGFRWDVLSSGKQHIQVGNGSSFARSATADGAMSDGEVHFIAVSIDEPAATGFFYRDGEYDPISSGNFFDASYSSPSASAALYQMQIGAGGNNSGRFESSSRMLGFGIVPSALTKAQLDSVYRTLKRW